MSREIVAIIRSGGKTRHLECNVAKRRSGNHSAAKKLFEEAFFIVENLKRRGNKLPFVVKGSLTTPNEKLMKEANSQSLINLRPPRWWLRERYACAA